VSFGIAGSWGDATPILGQQLSKTIGCAIRGLGAEEVSLAPPFACSQPPTRPTIHPSSKANAITIDFRRFDR
jgi:hypothetical protein